LRLAALALALVGSAPAAARTPARVNAVRPRSISVYEPDDPLRELKLRVEAITGLYEVNPPVRRRSERVVIKGARLQLTYWHSLGSTTEAELKTRAVRWLVLGRTQYATGARGIFEELPAIDEVTLVFHEVVRPRISRRRQGPETIAPYLALRLSRASFETLDLDAISACAEAGDCVVAFDEMFDEARFDRRYYRKRRATIDAESP